MSGVACPLLGHAEAQEEVQPLAGVHPWLPGVETFERLLVVGDGFVVGQLGESSVAGALGIGHGLVGRGGGSGRPGPVVSQRGEVVVESSVVDGLDTLGDPAVQRHPAHPGKALVEGVPHQGVGEAVPAPGRLDDEAGCDRLLQRADQLLLVEASRHPDQLRFELRPDHRRRTKNRVGFP